MDPFIGEIRIFGFNFAPQNWALCQGQLMSIAQNTALFSLLGTMYGGNGQTTFGLPDLRGRVPNSFGQGPGLQNYTQGQLAGSESVTLTAGQIAAHTHPFAPPATTADASAQSPANAAPANGGAYKAGATNTTMTAGTTGPNSGGQPVSILQPYLTLNFCIALQGIFPSRS